MHILVVTNMFPTAMSPASGTFVEQQVCGLRSIGLDVTVMLVDRVQKGMSSYYAMGWRLRRLLAERHVDLVHVMYGGFMADIATLVSPRPTVVSFCGSDLLGELLSGTARKFISRLGVSASHRAARRATGIVVKSKNLEEALPQDIDRRKVRIIPNGVDLELFRPISQTKCREQLGWRPDRFHILFPTTCGDPRKRFDLAQAAVMEARRQGLKCEIHELRGASHSAVPVWLNASDVVILTSLHEGSPNVVKEALACNVPVVSVAVGDVVERISPVRGCYVAEANPQDLAAKLCLVASEMRRTNGRDAMQLLSLKGVALSLEKFYADTVASVVRSTHDPGIEDFSRAPSRPHS